MVKFYPSQTWYWSLYCREHVWSSHLFLHLSSIKHAKSQPAQVDIFFPDKLKQLAFLQLRMLYIVYKIENVIQALYDSGLLQVFSVLCAWHLTKLSFLGHLGLMDNVAQDLLFLQQLVFVQCLLLAKVVVMLLLVLLQLIQCPLQGSTNLAKRGREMQDSCQKCIAGKHSILHDHPWHNHKTNVKALVSAKNLLSIHEQNNDSLPAPNTFLLLTYSHCPVEGCSARTISLQGKILWFYCNH